MKRPWLYYISPFVLLVLSSLFLIGYGLILDNNMIALVIFLFIALLILGTDYFIKWITNGRLLYIWIIEAILIALFFVWLSYMGSFRLSGC